MIRKLLPSLALLVLAIPVSARVAAPPNPVQRALRSDAVLLGKVTAIEKETISAIVSPGSPDKIDYQVAVVKVDASLVGAENLTHIKIGFIPAAPVDPNTPAPPRRGFAPYVPTVGSEGLFFLSKHPSGKFYVVNALTPPVDAQAESFKEDVAAVKKTIAVLAEPMKALKAEKAEDRFFAATVLVTKYRTGPSDVEAEIVKVPADESKLILAALAGGDWTKGTPEIPSPMQAFYALALNDRDGWTPPKVAPGEDFVQAHKTAFMKWLDGPGKTYQINRIIAKK